VLATQNPIEHEGTYPLPEAQVDRFLIKLTMRYPRGRREAHAGDLQPPAPSRAGDRARRRDPHAAARRARARRGGSSTTSSACTSTRSTAASTSGASPRAALRAPARAKARALVKGRDFVLPDDVKYLAPYVLRPPLMLTPEAELEGASARPW
jgi:MoxR-like ATPase